MQFSEEEYDAIVAEEKRSPLGNVFRGPQGLFPLLNGYASFIRSFLRTMSSFFRQYMSRVCIVGFPMLFDDNHADELQGQSTAQTIGIAGHLYGRFIPTVERRSIDLM
jgi:hypothetical protein